MDALLKRFRGQAPKETLTNSYPDDDVYPLHAFDDTKTLRGILIAWTLCFNDVLDADKLQSSLTELLEIGDWRKLGGRIRLNQAGALEVHVPRTFTKERPAFSFSNATHDIPIEEHEVAKSLPKPNGSVSTWSGPQQTSCLATRSDAPATLQDLLADDTPQISVHMTSFTNATLVGLSFPHTMMDVMGQSALLQAWSLVLSGRATEVPPVLGAKEDMIRTITDTIDPNPEPYVLKPKLLQGLGMLKFGARFGWDMVTGAAVESRTMCLTKETMTQLREQAEDDLSASSDGEKAPFVSDGDILTAWSMRAVALSSAPSTRPMTALHAMNARFRLPALANAQGVYLQNMLVPAYTFLTPELSRGPLGPIALANREALKQQATEAQVTANLREQRVLGDPSAMMCTEPTAVLASFTDWSKAKIWGVVDFGPAVVKAGKEGKARKNPPGSVLFQHCTSRRPGTVPRLFVHVLGKDFEGSVWVTMSMVPAAWREIEASLEVLGRS
ncbi:hypothetical protein TW65_02958 [Stemphylium lycopersici]|nr:hypothetical protein TW65_02958 [Stemphylium lycopersici]